MSLHSSFVIALCMVALLGVPLADSIAEPGDTTWVHTFDQDLYNWATPHDSTFTFPSASLLFSEILLYYTIGCPEYPNDCDPWDRLGYLRVLHDTGNSLPSGEREVIPYEIARIITPYDITGGNRPGTCTWILDVSDYEMLLHGEVTLRNYIESWIGGNSGWLVTIDFAFIEGIPEAKPISIENLWQNYHLVFGNPNDPVEDHLQPLDRLIDPSAELVKIRSISTGHGQGNTQNCAEFCAKRHYITANDFTESQYIWRYDCESNLCSPQGGTWQYDRAGWCPGDKVTPWDVDVTGAVVPGEVATLDYDLQDYVNECRPDNPNCIDGVTCADCDYNSTGHTQPILALQTQLIQYRLMSTADIAVDWNANDPSDLLRVFPSRPNPFRSAARIEYAVREAAEIQLLIYDAAGRQIRVIEQAHDRPGTYQIRWDGRNDQGETVSGGLYFYALHAGGQVRTERMLLLK